MAKPTNEITAVLDEDLQDVLEKLGIYDDIRQGERKCVICRDKVTLESIGLIFLGDTEPRFVCAKETCLTTFALGEDDDTESI